MGVRWVGLARKRVKAPFCKHRFSREAVRTLGAAGFLCMAAAMNFALYPDALAAVVSGDRGIVGFVPEEPSGHMLSDQQPTALNEEEVRLLAATVWGEARGEGEEGMRAVAHVMVNRIGERFGEDLATVILSPKQFSVWNGDDPNRRLVARLARDPASVATDDWLAADRIAREVLGGQSVDPTGGALFYHTRAVRPRWSRAGRGRQVIGQHVFYADVPDPGRRRTPRTIDVAQYLGLSLSSDETPQPPPSEAADQAIDVNAAATPTINGAPYAGASSAADTSATISLSAP
jgi:hypothetical protein